jgi:hypothetical protein
MPVPTVRAGFHAAASPLASIIATFGWDCPPTLLKQPPA